MAKEGEADMGAAGMDKEMVEVGSMEFAMATVIAEAEALDPVTLEEARRRMDWLKWDLVIKVELEALKKVGTWGVIERPRGKILLHANGYCTSRRMQLERSSATRFDSLQKGLLRSMAWNITRPLHQLPNLLLFTQYSLLLLAIIGQSTCLISTVLSFVGNLMMITNISWSNCLAMKDLTPKKIVSSKLYNLWT